MKLLVFGGLAKVSRKHPAENCAVNRANDRIAGERTSAARTANKFVIGKPEPASDEDSDNGA
jgi:hypothetical protein